jgi:hypothetical protein
LVSKREARGFFLKKSKYPGKKGKKCHRTADRTAVITVRAASGIPACIH